MTEENLIVALSQTLKSYLNESNSTRLIQKTFRALEKHLHANYMYIAIQECKDSYFDVKHYHGISLTEMKEFHKKIGSNTIGRIFFKDLFNVIVKDGNTSDYDELKIEKDYAMCVTYNIEWQGRIYGFLACYFEEPIEIDAVNKNFFISMADICSAALEKEELLKTISGLRQFDVESGLYSHQHFISKLEEEIHASILASTPMSLIILDMDNFTPIINLHGNDAVLQVLGESARELKNHIRGCDILASHGIDEFILYMPGTTSEKAQELIQTFNNKLENRSFTDEGIKTSFSCGITQLRESKDDIDALMQRAHLALYISRKTANRSVSIEL